MNWRAFLSWWLTQLAEWIPPQLRARLAPGHDALVIAVEPAQLHVYAKIDGTRHDYGPVTPGEQDAHRDRLRAFLAGLPHRPERIEVQLPAGRYLQRELELPLAAGDNLYEAVGFQLDRVAPFEPAEAIYHCGVLARDPAAKRLRAWVAVAPRQAVEQALRLLGDPAPQPVPMPKAPPPEGAAMVVAYSVANRRGSGLTWALLALNLVLFGAALTLHLNHRQYELEQLEQALGQVRREAADAVDLVDSAERIRAEALAMRDRRTAQPLLVAVLEDLSARLGDDTWLQRFEARGDELRLYGVSNSASNLIGQLEASPLLANVRFEASVNRDAVSGGDRFSITARMVPPEPDQVSEVQP